MSSDNPVTQRPSSRDRLPGISAKFDAVSAGKLWNFAVAKEMHHLEVPRLGAEDVDAQPGLRMSRFIQPELCQSVQKVPSVISQRLPPNEKKTWEEKYRFFSRPFNVERQRVQGFENYRMRQLFPVRQQAKDDPVIDHSPEEHSVVDLQAVGRDFERTLNGAIDELQMVRNERGNEAQFAGMKWHKYKYFSGGNQYPSTGSVDRFFKVDRPASFLRGSAPVPIVRPSLIRNAYYGN